MKSDTREKILSAGADIVLHKGFNHTGIQEILKAADVPKGSFYFYFESKEHFGLQLIDYYQKRISTDIEKGPQTKNDNPLSTLKKIFDWSFGVLRCSHFKGGCPIGNLSLEMSDINENFRVKLHESVTGIKKRIQDLIEQARRLDLIDDATDARMLSDFIFSSWEGTLLSMKVSKSAAPAQSFMDIIFSQVLKPKTEEVGR